MIENKDFTEKLKIGGIMCKGFGIAYKFIMQDTDLSPESKAICNYFASFAGNKDSAFPGRSKILSDLAISKESYYRHLKQLIKHGYIRIEREKKFFGRNTYYLVSCPEKLKQKGDFPHLKDCGYGIIPKAVMTDSSLDITAKALYAYFTSSAGNGNIAFPKQSTILYHLNICETTYQKYLKQLVACNYIRVERQRTSGRYDVNRYSLVQFPNEADENQCQPPCPKKQDTIKQDRTELNPTRQDDNITSSNKNNFNTNNSISSVTFPSAEDMGTATHIKSSVDDEIEKIKDIINYNYQILLYPDSKDDIDNGIKFVAETLANEKESFLIGSSLIQKDSFREVINSLTIPNIAEVWQRIRNSGRKIINLKNYVLSSLYNQAGNSRVHDPDEMRVEYKTFDLEHFFKLAVENGMRT